MCQCCCVPSIIYNWAKCQAVDYTKQLEAGIRYLDLRVSTKHSGDDELYLLHTIFSHPVRHMAKTVAIFLQSHKTEVVLLDFNHFQNMSTEKHDQCIHMLQDIFGDKMCPFSEDIEDINLNYLWEKKFQVIAFYHHDHAKDNQHFWPGVSIPSPWPSATDTEHLLNFLEGNYKRGRNTSKFHVSQGVLTPNAAMITKHLCSTLITECSDKCGDTFVQWLEEKTAGKNGINICIIDFAHKYNYIPTVLSLNQKLVESETSRGNLNSDV